MGDQVIVIEFKVGAGTYDRSATCQVIDYALDLRNFHEGCRSTWLNPVLVATDAPFRVSASGAPYDQVYPTMVANRSSLAAIIAAIAARASPPTVSHREWLTARYRPTPTIIKASQALYQGHQVAEITHAEAGADNLGATTAAIAGIIDQARRSSRKAICLVTGVPGAGKTLAGLNLVCQHRQREGEGVAGEHAVFLSGNGPLVDVLREALALDDVSRAKSKGGALAKDEALRRTNHFIQSIHHFRDAYVKDLSPPVDQIAVYDEAQRAWDREQAMDFMRTKRGQSHFDQSEPAFLISVMDRHPTWAVIVCLIGGGQEINTGEAGLAEWLRALRDHFPHWLVHVSDRLESTDSAPAFVMAELGDRVVRDPSLHLGVSLRSFRSERMSTGVAALMSGRSEAAAQELACILPRFPIVVSRSLAAARSWVRAHARGSERYGQLASSGGKRLKPLGIVMGLKVDPCCWFLNDHTDVRSSFYLEDTASEFDVQGLELDWTIVAWDGDLIHQPDGGWRFRAFKGTKWQDIREEAAQCYRLNAYRVLLTRARQGMAIVVPHGDPNDPTRLPAFYDPTWAYLTRAGIPELLDAP
ncbi:MAG: DUF2075 domain-containing protein [Planctomycetes bacterium]|nr:DUF2075 domain-containing protein [Planctomycetota bacterium]